MNPVVAWLESREGRLWSMERHHRPAARLGRFSADVPVPLAHILPLPAGVGWAGTPVWMGPLDPGSDPCGRL